MLSLLIIFFGSGKSGKDDDGHHQPPKRKVTLMEMIFLFLLLQRLLCYSARVALLPQNILHYCWLDDAVVCLVFKNAVEGGK